MTISKGPQAFPRTEYLRRLAAVKTEMGRRDIDTLLLTNTANINYLTGNLARIYSTHALVVSIHEEEPTLLVRLLDVSAAIHTTFMKPHNVIGYSEGLVTQPGRDAFDAMIDLLHERELANHGLGLEMGYVTSSTLPTQYLSASTIEKFKTRLPNARIADCTKLVDWIRIVKSDLEIAVMREAAAIADTAMMCAAEVIRPGVREADAAAEIVAAQVRGGKGTQPATGMLPPLICSSPRTGTAHIMWSEDVFRDGSQINVELSGIRYNYVAAIMRTLIIGAPSERLRRVHEAQMAGLEAALETVRPGRTCSDIANAFYRTIEKMGVKKVSRCGYSIGIDWVEKTASLADGDMTELKPNMTFHLMLGNWIDEDFGYVISETFRVTDSGVEVLTNVPRKLFEL